MPVLLLQSPREAFARSPPALPGRMPCPRVTATYGWPLKASSIAVTSFALWSLRDRATIVSPDRSYPAKLLDRPPHLPRYLRPDTAESRCPPAMRAGGRHFRQGMPGPFREDNRSTPHPSRPPRSAGYSAGKKFQNLPGSTSLAQLSRKSAHDVSYCTAPVPLNRRRSS